MYLQNDRMFVPIQCLKSIYPATYIIYTLYLHIHIIYQNVNQTNIYSIYHALILNRSERSCLWLTSCAEKYARFGKAEHDGIFMIVIHVYLTKEYM